MITAMCAIGAGVLGFICGGFITMLIIEITETEMEIRELKETLESMKK
jgi:hypothetical protein